MRNQYAETSGNRACNSPSERASEDSNQCGLVFFRRSKRFSLFNTDVERLGHLLLLLRVGHWRLC
ncbi:hypothetical protein C8J31_12026 [Rhizobium sp. PP-CC-2G-626]|nr:hypothetical protein C8J31_12026 [Rhizobium sp. PP-CC-2G-626]